MFFLLGSLDDPYDLNNDQNDQELMLVDKSGKSSKQKKKKKRKDEEEIAKMIDGRRQDEDYIYLDFETPEENIESIKRSDDKMWSPGTSGKKIKPKIKKVSIMHSMQPSKRTLNNSEKEKQSHNESSMESVEKTKKPKKGLATPKQRLAKKLKMSM